MKNPERLCNVARAYLRECRAATNQQDERYYAECGFDFAQMAEALERSTIDRSKKAEPARVVRPQVPLGEVAGAVAAG